MCTGHRGLPFNVITGWLQSTITVITVGNSNVLLENVEKQSYPSALQQNNRKHLLLLFLLHILLYRDYFFSAVVVNALTPTITTTPNPNHS